MGMKNPLTVGTSELNPRDRGVNLPRLEQFIPFSIYPPTYTVKETQAPHKKKGCEKEPLSHFHSRRRGAGRWICTKDIK